VVYLTANRSEGKLNFKKLQQSCVTSIKIPTSNMAASLQGRMQGVKGVTSHPLLEREKIILQTPVLLCVPYKDQSISITSRATLLANERV